MKYLSPTDIAQRLGVSRRTAYRLLQSMPRVRLSPRILRVSERDFELYLAKRQERTWDASTDETIEPAGTATTRLLTESESSEVSAPRTSRSPKSVSGKPSWLRPLKRVAGGNG